MARSHGVTRSAALALLGLPGDASPRDITQAYRRLAKATHPDRVRAPAPAAMADPATSDAPQRFALLADAYHALASPPATSPPEITPSDRTTAPGPSTTPGPVPVAVRVRRPPGEPRERPPIVAGPVRITPSPPPAPAPWEST